MVLVAFILAAGAQAGSPSDAPIKGPKTESTTAIGQATDAMQFKRRHPSRPYQVGQASWYGRQFHGRKTASGEPYDMYQLTAAHRDLPLGSWVKVTNLRNHQWVLVRINDRGPVPKDRIIDLSYSAARMLDLKARGIGRVRIDLVDGEPSAQTLAMAKGPARF
jgi:rare lipoprotein A